jgi:hypothetical protein
MKRIVSILFVFMFGTVTVLAAQENQPIASPGAAPAAATTANAASGVITAPSTSSGDQQLVTISPEASKSPEQARADSENTPTLEGNPDASQNLVEYGGPG